MWIFISMSNDFLRDWNCEGQSHFLQVWTFLSPVFFLWFLSFLIDECLIFDSEHKDRVRKICIGDKSVFEDCSSVTSYSNYLVLKKSLNAMGFGIWHASCTLLYILVLKNSSCLHITVQCILMHLPIRVETRK